MLTRPQQWLLIGRFAFTGPLLGAAMQALWLAALASAGEAPAEDLPMSWTLGFLYLGLILTAAGPRLLEFNVRLGDPEAQALFLRLEDDLLPILAAGATGNFGVARLHFRKEASAVIVLASAGYPEKPVQGEPIEGLERAAALPNVQVFHAGTARQDGAIVAVGGRVLTVGATGATLAEALKSAYAAAYEIHWPAKIFRKDIGRRALAQGVVGGESGVFRLPFGTDS